MAQTSAYSMWCISNITAHTVDNTEHILNCGAYSATHELIWNITSIC